MKNETVYELNQAELDQVAGGWSIIITGTVAVFNAGVNVGRKLARR